ncbi:hypothetical protein ACFLV0_02055 [Chloroflexota bacterium]
MEPNNAPTTWKAELKGEKWQVLSSKNEIIAIVEKGSQDEVNAKLIAASPLMFEALSSLVQLIGDEDLPDNGELSGAAICDLARSAIAVAAGNKGWPFA